MISYDELVQRMNTAYEKQAGFVPDEASDTGVRFRVLAGEIYSLLTDLAWLKQSLLPQTAAGEQLDKLAQEQGLGRLQAAHAKGSVQFTAMGGSVVQAVLPAGTRCTTGGENPVLVETLEELQLPVEAGKTVSVQAQAVSAGAVGNVLAAAVTALTAANSFVSAVTNPQAFTGGRDAETDEQLRARLLQQDTQQNNGANPAFYRQLAEQQEGVFSASVQTATPAAGEVTVWLAGVGAQVADSTVQQVQKVLEAARELNVQVHVYPAKIVPLKLSFVVQEKEGQLKTVAQQAVRKAVQNSFSSLRVGETLCETQLYAQIYNTGAVQSVKLLSNTTFPTASEDTLVTLATLEVS
ncbi:baseplate J/gp47 family protein [Caproicibacterium amylolyticum]|uniref:Baseplate J/gp47 family protein n=1 Tax=Caproicibacterium amylolyticum TaxID=2766537 RepID=A0A7G9WGX3_9FIRM|nr:baseplate J/gp47 family protein [Caproicibacterium amylolyticum]QNO17935.1 baseplate J/gp47 family protein [Caproicibacterium amylolyticum]